MSEFANACPRGGVLTEAHERSGQATPCPTCQRPLVANGSRWPDHARPDYARRPKEAAHAA